MTIKVEPPRFTKPTKLELKHHPAHAWFRVVDSDGSTIAFIPDEPTALEYANFLNEDRSRYYGDALPPYEIRHMRKGGSDA